MWTLVWVHWAQLQILKTKLEINRIIGFKISKNRAVNSVGGPLTKKQGGREVKFMDTLSLASVNDLKKAIALQFYN